MGKLNIVVQDAPSITRNVPMKNLELFQEVAEAFNGLPLGKAFIVSNEDIASSTLEAKIRKMVTLKEGEHMRISKLTGADGKITGVRLAKVTPPKKRESDSEGTQEAAQ
jgi:hypothetical protein